MTKIDKDMCIGCRRCVNICPQGFEMVNGKAQIKDENAGCIFDAANICPRDAIIIAGNKNLGEMDTKQPVGIGFGNFIRNNFERGGKSKSGRFGRNGRGRNRNR